MTGDAQRIRLLMQLRRNGIHDSAVLSALERVPRELFIPDQFLDQAYEDLALPIARNQTISQPWVVAMMTQELRLDSRHKVLEIGTGSGYQTAVLARICRRVYTIERHKPLLEEAESRFQQMGIRNVVTRHGDGLKGWPEQAPFERIMATAAFGGTAPPQRLVHQLAVGGLMVLPMGAQGREQAIVRITRTETGFEEQRLWPVRFVPLVPDIPAEDL